MSDLAVPEGDWARNDSLVRRHMRGRPLDLSDRILAAMGHRDTAALPGLLAAVRSADLANVLQAVEFVSVYMHDVGVAEQLTRIVLDAPRAPTALRERAYDVLAHLELAAGRWSGARAVFESAEREGVDVESR